MGHIRGHGCRLGAPKRAARQYSVAVKAHGRERKLWSWEIRRVPELGANLYGEGPLRNRAVETPQPIRTCGKVAVILHAVLDCGAWI
jgi:hypothetical protein